MLNIRAAEESIWHFIGLFHSAEELTRLKIDYDKFSAMMAEPDIGPIELELNLPPQVYVRQDYQADAPYNPPGYKPIQSEPPLTSRPFELSGDVKLAPPASPQPFVEPIPIASPQSYFQPPPPVPPIVEPPDPDPQWELPVPGSYAVIAAQHNILLDDDDLLTHGTGRSADLGPELQKLVDIAEQLTVSLPVDMPQSEDAFLKLAQTFQNATAPGAVEGAETWTRQGDAVEGKYLNGVKVSEAPDIEALLPAYREVQRDVSDANPLTRVRDKDDDGVPDDHPQHELVFGNNTLVNEVRIVDAWIAAPVMAAAKGVYSYTVVSQTNVWSDIDQLAGQASAGQGAANPTQALNYSSFATISNQVSYGVTDQDDPQYWVTTTLKGSLVSVNWVDQYNFVSDNDVTTVSLQGAETLMLIGQNGALNTLSLQAIGSQFDLIVIDGYIINLNAVLQTNIMLDDDRVMTSGDGTTISSSDNLLINYSDIKQVGDATYAQTNTAFDTMLRTADDGTLMLPAGVIDDPTFKGLDVVRVLKIEGDLVSVNMIRQTNVLADSDDIGDFLEDVVETGAEVSVITGSNALINVASITEIGADSTVYTGGEVYSDALLHQAELVSADAPELAPHGTGLASEAVLFLAEGMITESNEDPCFHSHDPDTQPPSDIMQTVLT